MNSPGTLGTWEDRPRRIPDADITGVPLDSRAVFLLTRIDGSTSIADLCAMSGLDDAEAVKVLTQLRDTGLVTIEKAPPVRAPVREAPRPATPGPSRTTAASTAPGRPAGTPAQPSSGPTRPSGSAPRSSEPAVATPANGPRRDDVLLLHRYGRLGHVPAQIWSQPGEPRFGAFAFDKRELLEQVDLPLDLRKEILFLHYNAEKLDLYEFFDIAPTVDRKALRNAYFIFSKRFHPDTYFRKFTGSYGDKIQSIFKFANDVNDRFQSDDALRETYYRVVMARNDVRRLEQERRQAALQAEQLVQEKAQADLQQAETDTRKADLAQRLADRKQARRDRPDSNPMTVRLEKAEQYFHDGMKLYQEEKFVNAANSLQLALTFDPKNEGYRTAFERVNEKAKQVRAEQLWKQGYMHEQLGQTKEAMVQYREALEFWRRHDYLFHVAELMLAAGEDLGQAAELARLATEAAPQKVDYLLLLGKIYEMANLSKRAQSTYERALKLEPLNESVKKSLKALKRS